MSSADDQYEQQNDALPTDAPAGDSTDDDYTSRVGQKTAPVPVHSDNDPVTDPIDPATADSDETLAKDDNEAIDKSNIIGGRTRGAGPSGGYQEPSDEEGLPGAEDSGASRGASS